MSREIVRLEDESRRQSGQLELIVKTYRFVFFTESILSFNSNCFTVQSWYDKGPVQHTFLFFLHFTTVAIEENGCFREGNVWLYVYNYGALLSFRTKGEILSCSFITFIR